MNHSDCALQKDDLGYDTDSIASFEIDKSFSDFLLCQICCKMVREAKECDYCGKLFCKSCIENWLILNKDCPVCHRDIKIRGASRVVKEIIHSFRIKCSYCDEVVRLSEIEKHESQCGQITCDNPLCGKKLKHQKYYEVVTSEGKLQVCNDICEQVAKFKRLRHKKGQLDCLKFFQATLSSGNNSSSEKRVKIRPQNPDIDAAKIQQKLNIGTVNSRVQLRHNLNTGSILSHQFSVEDADDEDKDKPEVEIVCDNENEPTIDATLGVVAKLECMSPGFIKQKQKAGICNFAWDPAYASDVIEITGGNRSVFLKEEQYIFRTVIADKGFTEGTHYWEIVADARTENELKIGVCKNRDFDLKTAFSDYSFGWAYYAVGQLRHCDGANGQTFGNKQMKKEGILGVYLDMTKGQLAVSVNNEFQGIAFEDEELKKGPIWPAIALLHAAGCTLVTGRAPPSIFFAQI